MVAEANATGSIDLPVLGMTCAACVRRVERAVAAVPGVARAEVNLPLSRAHLELVPGSGATAASTATSAAAAIRAAGYEVPADVLDAIVASEAGLGTSDSRNSAAARERAIAAAERANERGLRRDAILALALAALLMPLAMTSVVPPTASAIAQLALGTLAMFGPGRRYLRGGAIAVRHGAPDMNTLIALGAGAAWLASSISALRWLAAPEHDGAMAMPPMLYFDATAAIVAFVMIGKLLEARARSRVADAVRGLLALAPSRARVRVGDGDREVDASALVAGDVMLVRPGERVAADGTIVEGRSALDESILTGEALPVDKAAGAAVYAGTLNQHGALVVRVARAGADTAVARIARAVEAAQGNKAPIARLADRVSAWFVPAVLAIAAITAVAWAIGGAGAGVCVERAVAVLVIACPCALGLATPAAVAVGTSRGAELGVLFGGGDALERASAIDVACIDKTGTLTAGQPALIDARMTDEQLALAASAEQASEHPIARAIVAGAKARGLALAWPQDVASEPGGGLAARVGEHQVRIGTRAFVGAAASERSADDVVAYASISHVAIDGAYAGYVAVADPPAADAKAAVAALRALGVEPVMISGDRKAAAEWIAAAVGIARVHAEVRPTGKAAIVAAERAGGHRVAMIGDGVNDAPALAAADLGIALGSGADVAAAAADVTLLRGGIAAVPVALGLARQTLRVIRRNLFAAFAYNAICIPVAAAGLLSPMLASAAMSLSSVSVLLSSLRLRRYAVTTARATGAAP